MRLVTLPGVFRPISDTWLLADALDREPLAPGARVLDLCAGSGALAVRAALGGRRDVTAVDVSRRAVLTVRINAALNRVRVRARRGDLFAAVAGERFDAIVCNPPYVPVETSFARAGARVRGRPAATAAPCSTASATAPTATCVREARCWSCTRRCSGSSRRSKRCGRPGGRRAGPRARPARPADDGPAGASRGLRPARAGPVPRGRRGRTRAHAGRPTCATRRAEVAPRALSVRIRAWPDRSGAARSPSDW